MPTTGLGASLKYGGKLFTYFFLIIVLGGSGVTLGGILAGPQLQTLFAGGNPDVLALSGGVLVAGLGAALVVIGTFSITFKLISDAVSKGINDGVETLDVSVTELPEELEVVALNGGTENSPTDIQTEQTTAETAVESTSQTNETTDDESESPQPEQSAEEIVFGTAADQEDATSESPIEQAESAAKPTEATPEPSQPDDTGSSEPLSGEELPVSESTTANSEADASTGISDKQPDTPDDLDETGVGELDIESEEGEETPSFEELDGGADSDKSADESWEDDPLAD